jgi:hypothetical protein
MGVQGSVPSILKVVYTVLAENLEEVALMVILYSLEIDVGVKLKVLEPELYVSPL